MGKKKKSVVEKCKKCWVQQEAERRGLTLFKCRGLKDEAFCNLHYDPIT
jgi:hypothetical protein